MTKNKFLGYLESDKQRKHKATDNMQKSMKYEFKFIWLEEQTNLRI